MIQTYQTRLSQKTRLTGDIYLFKFNLDEPKEINFIAGQYLILKISDRSRLYSIASPDWQKDSFELLIQIIPGGLASTYLLNLKVGDQVNFEGPAGLFRLQESQRDKIFLATGTGIAPIRSMIKSVIKKLSNEVIKEKKKNPNYSITQLLNYSLFWGLRHFSDVCLLDELKNFKFHPDLIGTNFKFYFCLSREQNLDMIPKEERKYFLLGHINNGLEQKITNYQLPITNYDFYLCGSREVVESLRQYLYQKGVPKGQVYFEKF